MPDNMYAVLGLGLVTAIGAFFLLYRWRYNNFTDIPTPMKRNLFIGHLGYIASEYKNLPNPAAHPDYALERVWKAYNYPDYMFFDTRPAEHPLTLITSHELAEQITRSTKQQPYSTTKSPTVQEGFGPLVGPYSLLSEEGESWKNLRRRFNSGFAPSHLLTLLPVVFKKTQIFVEKLDALAKKGIAAELEPLCTNVTFDIISEVVTNVDCNAQAADPSESNDIVKNFRLLGATYLGDNNYKFVWLKPYRKIKRYMYGRLLDQSVKKCVQEKFQDMQTDQKNNKDRSVLALSLNNTETLTPEILQKTADQVKTFMFAGHDTTSILLQRLFYELSIHPGCLSKLRAEHDSIFGDRDPEEVFLERPEETMKALVYTSACIKEALRLWPPASSARMSHNGLTLNTSQGSVCFDETVIYVCHYLIQRDPKVYGETANDFVPDRWIDDVDTSSANADMDAGQTSSSSDKAKIPISAWRPFERGPRNCIGQELANIEARVILVCTIRRYDFTKVGTGEVELDEKGQPMMDEKGRYKTKSELVNLMSVTSKPIDKTIMKLKFHKSTH